MRGYVSRGGPVAPVIADDGSLEQAIRAIVADKSRLVRLARYKAGRDTAKWNAITRIKWEYQELREDIIKHPLLQGVEIREPSRSQEMESRKIDFQGR